MPFTHLQTTYSLDRVNNKTRTSPFQELHPSLLGQPVRQPNQDTVSTLDRYAPMSLYTHELVHIELGAPTGHYSGFVYSLSWAGVTSLSVCMLLH